jgi:hypothetical protein
MTDTMVELRNYFDGMLDQAEQQFPCFTREFLLALWLHFVALSLHEIWGSQKLEAAMADLRRELAFLETVEELKRDGGQLTPDGTVLFERTDPEDN